MILTNCAACAAPLAHTAPRCVRCHTRCCNQTCQHDHWRRGHKQICKKIHRGGNAEQYNADKKYKEAVAVAVKACAADTKGQTCFICTQALHWKTKEGLVRGCACRGTAGFAHVSFLAEQAKILIAEAKENNLGPEVLDERLKRWNYCSLCEQMYHGVVSCALGWACWKTYVGRPETDQLRQAAMNRLGLGLSAARHHEAALSVKETELATLRRLGASQHNLIGAMSNIANTFKELGRLEQGMYMQRDIHVSCLKIFGKEGNDTLVAANNYANSLNELKRCQEARAVLCKTVPVARRVLGESHELTLRMRLSNAVALYNNPSATLDDLRESMEMFEDVERTARRVLGGAHPITGWVEDSLHNARASLHTREAFAKR